MRVTSRCLVLFVVLALPWSSGAAESVGSEVCKGCHPAAYQTWQESEHARALESLSEKQQKDGRCLSCHAPEAEKGLATGVSCETCHGGGQYYTPRYVMKDAELSRAVGLTDPSEKTCGKCHDSSAPSLQSFVFADKLKLVDHWTKERERKAQRAKEAAEAAAAAKIARPPKSEKAKGDKPEKGKGKRKAPKSAESESP